MATYYGDISTSDSINFIFDTKSVDTLTTLSGSPSLAVYKDNSTTQSTSGITLTVDFDSITGKNLVTINTSSDGTFYSAGSDFAVVIAAGTIDGISVVGRTVGTFSIENRSFIDDIADVSAQISNIGAASGGAINFAPTADNTSGAIDPSSATFVGSVSSGTFASVGPGTGASHSIDDSGNDIDIVYKYEVGGGRIANNVSIFADVDDNADVISVKVYDHVGETWDTIGEIDDNDQLSLNLVQKHTGTGSELGNVYIRFETDSTTPSNLEIFESLVSAVNNGSVVGYANGAIWIDTNNGSSGTTIGVNGVADNPVDSLSDALTLASSTGLSRFVVAAGSSITLSGAATNYEFMGNNWTIALGGQSIAGAKINGATVSGTFSGTTAILEECIINAITGPGLTMRRCYLNDITITANGAGSWYMNDCRSRVAGFNNSPNFDFGEGVGDTQLNIRLYSGGLELENMGDTGTDIASIEGLGNITLNSNCDGGELALRGPIGLTDNSGNVSVQFVSPFADVLNKGLAQSATANTITLQSSASSTDGQYDPSEIIIVAGTGAGQSRNIIEYTGSTKVAVVDRDWRVNPDSSSSYVIKSTSGSLHVNEGLAQAGASGSITLNAAASSTDDIYIGQTVFLVGGTGQDQARIVTDYNGTTKVATVHKNWDTNPDSTTGYVMIPLPTLGDRIEEILADTNELQSNQGDWATATGFSTHSAADVWGVGTRTLSAFSFNVNLADDAITSAKFDESTAFPITSADSGSTQIARTGADSDTLETLSDEIAGLSSSDWTTTEKDQIRYRLNIDGDTEEPSVNTDLPSVNVTQISGTAEIETGYSPAQLLRLISSALLGKSSSDGTTFRDINDTTNRIVATVDDDGNRTAISYTAGS